MFDFFVVCSENLSVPECETVCCFVVAAPFFEHWNFFFVQVFSVSLFVVFFLFCDPLELKTEKTKKSNDHSSLSEPWDCLVEEEEWLVHS